MFRIVTGAALIIVAIVLLYFAAIESLILLVHAGVVGGIGVAILLNKNEDSIEEIRNNNEKKDE